MYQTRDRCGDYKVKRVWSGELSLACPSVYISDHRAWPSQFCEYSEFRPMVIDSNGAEMHGLA